MSEFIKSRSLPPGRRSLQDQARRARRLPDIDETPESEFHPEPMELCDCGHIYIDHRYVPHDLAKGPPDCLVDSCPCNGYLSSDGMIDDTGFR